jgi:arabinofuranosyltransferase
MSRRGPALVVALALGVAWARLLAVNGRSGMFLPDDTLISYRYAERLAAGHGLTWTDGERVEGYSNLAWVLLLAAARGLGFDLLDAGRELGFACAVVALAALTWSARPRALAEVPATFAAPLALATASPFAVWATAGLEQPLLAAALAAALALARDDDRRPHALGAALALLCWTRPDGALLAAAVGVGWWVRRPERGPDARVVAAWPAAAVLAQHLFRGLYYGAMVPNTAKAKLAFTAERLADGGDYAASAAAALWPLLLFVPVALAAALAARRGRDAWLYALPFVAWTAYLVFIGGDIFPAHRHAVLLVVLAAFAVADLLRVSSARAALAAALVALAVPLLLDRLAASDLQARRAERERWEWDGLALGRHLRELFAARDPLVAVDPAGAVPFASGLRSLDMLGLTDATIAARPPASFGTRRIGHELGDGAYVLGRQPDLVLFCDPSGRLRPCFRSGRQMVADPRWAAEYRPMVLQVPGRSLRTVLYARTVSERIGAQEDSAGRVEVPLYLLTGASGVARATGDGLEVVLPAGAVVELPVRVPRDGSYWLMVDAAPREALAVGAPRGGGGVEPAELLVAEGRTIRLALAAHDELVLTRLLLVPE